MAYNPSPEYETAQSRISTLLDQIGEQLQAIVTSPNGSTDVDNVIAEKDKSFYIFKQNELISAYRERDKHDERDAYIFKLEENLDKAKRQVQEENARLYKQYQINKELKAALKSLTTVLTED